MCDFSLHAVASRPAQVGETLVTTTFRNTSTRGLASPDNLGCAVCIPIGAELAFEGNVRYTSRLGIPWWVTQRVAKFIKQNMHDREKHHDAIEFVSGKQISLQHLDVGQRVKVVQLPAVVKPAKASETTIAPPIRVRSEERV